MAKAPVIQARARASVVGAPNVTNDGSREVTQAAVRFGQTLSQVSGSWIEGLREANLNKAYAETEQTLAGLEEKYTQLTDPDEIERGFNAEATEALQKISGTIRVDADRQRLQSHIQRRLISVDKRVNNHRLNLVASTALGDLSNYVEDALNQAAVSESSADRAVVIAGVQDRIGANVDAGWLAPARAAALEQSFNNRLSKIDAKTDIEKDPEAALEALKDTERYIGLTPEDRLQLRDAARADIAALQRGAAAANRKAVAAAKSGITEIERIVTAGLQPAEELIARTRTAAIETGDAETIAAYNDMLRLKETGRIFAGLTPNVLQQAVTQLESEAATPIARKQVTLARSILGTMKSALASDPLSWAAKQPEYTMPELALASDDFPAQAAERIALGNTVHQRYGSELRYLTDEESRMIAGTLETASPDDAIAIVTRLADGFGSNVQQVLSEVSKDNGILAHAAGLAASGEFGSFQHKTARRVFTGLKALKENPDLKIDRLIKADVLRSHVGDAFGTQAGLRANVIAAADALYADALLRGQISEGDEEQAYADMLDLALGGDGETGGIAEINGFSTILPTGFIEDRLQQSLSRATANDLLAASEGGGAPEHMGTSGRQRMQADELEDMRLVPVGDGRYLLQGEEGGYVLGTGINGFYVLDVRKLDELTNKADPATAQIIDDLTALQGINR